jgi:parvulin-like peptidyl-prolyl isomerase
MLPSCNGTGLKSAQTAGSDLSLNTEELLASLRRSFRLKPLVLEALAEKLIRRACQEAGLAVSTEELQQAANRFRQQQGLRTIDTTNAWLEHNGLRVFDLEAMLEQTLLAAKFRNHLAEGLLETHFAANADRYVRARISYFTVPTEGLARELLARIRDDGADFAELARQHAGSEAATHRVVMRADLPTNLADLVLRARPDSVTEPVPGPGGWRLFHVHERLPAQLDELTAVRIRHDILAGWLGARLAHVSLDSSFLNLT